MWKHKRTSRKRKNDKKIAEAEEFKQQREEYMRLQDQFRQEFIEFCEQREKEYQKDYNSY